ncbi:MULTISPECIES: SgcJ/EcaC family oxidoreductase [unclassified Nocardia]|uniref:SgcJ/EcaC family oxidoreductase n=1 Tax=unclassified Nocardia TaxID=2637762 RepID=UPI001CE3D014|nr:MULTISPECIES: SgcJ/EcaC family oxidoreductase [unclassified Nocardia]
MTVDQHTDELAIRELFQRQSDAWAAGDAKAFSEVFTEDADYITFLGTYHRGRTEIETMHTPLFERFQKGSRLDGAELRFRFLTPDVAIVQSVGALVKGKGKRTKRNTKVQTTVVVRQDGEWRIAAFQNTKYGWLLAGLSAMFDRRMAPSIQVA